MVSPGGARRGGGILASVRHALDEPAAVSVEVENGLITRIHVVRSPHKLTQLDEPARPAG
ncbi:hypothetical protein [Streptomyces halstedii]|uniref:hypothetical protein n=1 Tax=Streptomyces halstedii TaxID=1944 RepID=UPI0039C0079B